MRWKMQAAGQGRWRDCLSACPCSVWFIRFNEPFPICKRYGNVWNRDKILSERWAGPDGCVVSSAVATGCSLSLTTAWV